MRKMSIPVLLLLAAGCTNTIEHDFSKIEPRLMAVALLEQGDAEHSVFISLSEGGVVKRVENASLICFVNGEQVATASSNASDFPDGDMPNTWNTAYNSPSYYRQLPVSFTASFQPGDKLRLEFEADGGKYKASSGELTVPAPVEISSLDTTRVTVRHLDWSDSYLQLQAGVPDRKGEDNWYCVCIQSISDGIYSFKDGGPDIPVSVRATQYIHDIDDPILLDGGLSQTNDLNMFNFLGNGAFACFSDQLFRDGTARLKMNAFASWNKEGPDFMALYGRLFVMLGSAELEARELDRCRATRRLEVKLSNCSEATYFYLRALRTVSSEGYRPEIVEPVTVPGNIVGGVGFVDIVTSDIKAMELSAKEETYVEDW